MNALRLISTVVFAVVLATVVDASDFFELSKIRYIYKHLKSDSPVYNEISIPGQKKTEKCFLPYIQVDAKTREQTAGIDLFAKIYFYNTRKQLIHSSNAHPVEQGKNLRSPFPTFFPKGKNQSIFFSVPEAIQQLDSWRAIIVFGDRNEVAVSSYPVQPAVNYREYSFPEYNIYQNPVKVSRLKAQNPLIEYVAQTRVDSNPQITFFLRKPIGIDSFSEAKGVLAICVLSSGVDQIKKLLQEAEKRHDLSEILQFAEDNKLIILCWGSQSFWNSKKNWDDLTKEEYNEIDRRASQLADAWEKAVKHIARKYDFTVEDLIFCGFSGAAQYAMRLVMKKPDYFLAVHIHIPSSFDEPVPEANKVLWCLTTGECEIGYKRSIRFLQQAQTLHYPIVYKAIPGLGHASHSSTTELGIEFFRYALSVKNERRNASGEIKKPFWPRSLRNPYRVGDVYRHEVYSPEKIPDEPGIRIPLPTEDIAKIWSRDGLESMR